MDSPYADESAVSDTGATSVDTSTATTIDTTTAATSSESAAGAVTDPTTAATTAGASADASAAATTVEGAAAAAAGATAAQVMELEGRLNGQPFKLPLNAEIPWKRGSEQGFATIEEIQKSHMFERDYRLRTTELANQRREYQQQQQAERIAFEKSRRQLDVERQFVEKEQARVMEALTSPDPAVRERHAKHFEMLRSDPEYAERYQKSLRADAYDAVNAFDAELAEQQQTQAVLQDIQDTATAYAAEYPGVNVQRVLARYGQAVTDGRADLTTDALRAVFEDEAQYLATAVNPLQSQLDAMKAELAKLQAGTTAAQHNTAVRTTLEKAATARAVPAVGRAAPPSPSSSAADKPKPRSRHEAHQQFLRG